MRVWLGGVRLLRSGYFLAQSLEFVIERLFPFQKFDQFLILLAQLNFKRLQLRHRLV